MTTLLTISIVIRIGIAAWAFVAALQMRSRVMMLAGTVSALAALEPVKHAHLGDGLIIAIDAIASVLLAILVIAMQLALRSAAQRLDALRIQALAAQERQTYADRLHAVIKELITRGDLTDMPIAEAAAIVTEQARAALESTRAGVWILEDDSSALRCIDLFDGTHASGTLLSTSDYPRYFEAIASGRAVDATDAQSDPRTSEFTDGYLQPFDIKSMLDAAIRMSGRVAGVICIEQSDERRAWSTEEMEFVGELGDLLGGLLAHATAVSARNALIVGLAKLADYRDNDTGSHLDRIRSYSRLIAEAARAEFPEIDDEWIRNLEVASSLHDIGKVGIADDILLKPGPLTPEERIDMQRHATIGADTLIEVQRHFADDPLITMGLQVALQHHERWDGTGYPCGISGNQICLSARIVAAADVYDALTSRRVYKEAIPHAEACAVLREGAGSQFDSRVIAAFLSVHEKIDGVRRELAEPRALNQAEAA